jgi:hypothetical protein
MLFSIGLKLRLMNLPHRMSLPFTKANVLALFYAHRFVIFKQPATKEREKRKLNVMVWEGKIKFYVT